MVPASAATTCCEVLSVTATLPGGLLCRKRDSPFCLVHEVLSVRGQKLELSTFPFPLLRWNVDNGSWKRTVGQQAPTESS